MNLILRQVTVDPDTIMTFGGLVDGEIFGTATNAVFSYSVSGNRWTTAPSMATARSLATCGLVG